MKIDAGGDEKTPPQTALTMDDKGVVDLTGKQRITLQVGKSILEMNSDGEITITCKKFVVHPEERAEIVGENCCLVGNCQSIFLTSKKMMQLRDSSIIHVSSGRLININGAEIVNVNGNLIKLNQ